MSQQHGESIKPVLFAPLWTFLCVFLLGQFTAAATPGRPSVILITIDTVRADRMGFLGSTQALTPNLDALARHSVVFTRAYSQVPITNPSHATILTGTYPQFHHVNDFHVPLAGDLPYLPDILHAHGYATAAFVSSFVLDPKTGAPGFNRGFDTFDGDLPDRRLAADTAALALAWIKEHRSHPFFVWIHLYDCHIPYEPPEPFKSRYPSKPYNGAIAYDDSSVGTIVTSLRELGLYNNTVIAIASDHGEAFGEHGEREHGYFLYDETIHVPLLLKLPGERLAGTRSNARAGLVDLMPTILEIVGLPVPAAVQGESLIARIKTGSMSGVAADHPVYSETDYPYLAFGWSPLRALRAQNYLFIEAPRKELYDQSSDAHSEKNLATSSPAVTAILTTQLDAFRKKTSKVVEQSVKQNSARQNQNQNKDPRQEQKLASLGYVASSQSAPEIASASIGSDLADPKDKIEVANKTAEALLAMQQGHHHEAIPLLQYAVVQEPKSANVNRALGECFTWIEDYKNAVPPLRRAVELGKDDAMTHYLLGTSLSGLEDWQGAASEFAAAAQRSPRWGDAHYYLAASYAHMERLSDAQKELEATVNVQPGHFPANLQLGQMLLLQHKPEEALPRLQTAVSLQPLSADAHRFLGMAYSRLGQEADATRERAEANRLEKSNSR